MTRYAIRGDAITAHSFWASLIESAQVELVLSPETELHETFTIKVRFLEARCGWNGVELIAEITESAHASLKPAHWVRMMRTKEGGFIIRSCT